MAATDFRSLLSVSMDEIKRPPIWPAGTYHGVVKPGYELLVSSRKKTPLVRYHFNVTGAGDDIEAADLEGIEFAKKDLTKDYYLTDESKFILKEFLQSCGVPVTGRGLGECIPEVVNCQVMITITQGPTQDGKGLRNEVGQVVGTEAVED